jgi:hypothetical protein
MQGCSFGISKLNLKCKDAMYESVGQNVCLPAAVVLFLSSQVTVLCVSKTAVTRTFMSDKLEMACYFGLTMLDPRPLI